jgi:hypothetical protein
MKLVFSSILILFSAVCFLYSNEPENVETPFWKYKIIYPLVAKPLDVIIPCAKKDQPNLNRCIQSIQTYCSNIRRIIVVSSSRLTQKAEWFNENQYPFSKTDVGCYLGGKDSLEARSIIKKSPEYIGWYYQQLLKLYAPFVIPNLSSNILVVDADTIFLNPVEFLNAEGGALIAPKNEYHIPYFEHMATFLTGLRRLDVRFSGIAHHMVFQKPILEALFTLVEHQHEQPLWQVFCESVVPEYITQYGASEYEIYFNFAFATTNQLTLRSLKSRGIYLKNHNQLEALRAAGYHYVNCHNVTRVAD